MQVFARRFPDLVGGVVLVDASHPDQLERLSPFMTPQARAGSRQFRTADNPEHLALGRSEAQARRLGPFPPIPLRVLMAPASDALLQEFAHKRQARRVFEDLARDQARLSPLGRLVRVSGTGHFIQIDRPDVVIRNIRQVVAIVRRNQART
jgi:pimeloyl-ACP methyl ester carboxylesterase